MALAWFVLSYLSMSILYAPTWPTFSALLSLTASGMRDQKPVCAKYVLGDTVSGNPWSNDGIALCIPRMRNNQHEIQRYLHSSYPWNLRVAEASSKVVSWASISMSCPSSTSRSAVLGTHPQSSSKLAAIQMVNYNELRCIAQHTYRMMCLRRQRYRYMIRTRTRSTV